ncbi:MULTISPECIES: hypothetical protein [unclassified Crossiella]|uniref:hypothetical protein n=1 Tax=unclassified Crossiella TaxID=2620835 RepID=UPI001FFF64D1|nr:MULTISPECIES: hypothetical protein [unclassified Crossiella]MCK2239134.1 hypothetical protein [Crossiella sp. S99.2]MCK2251297.1 hypothetical protein [Crossiella sp. S99.1]
MGARKTAAVLGAVLLTLATAAPAAAAPTDELSDSVRNQSTMDTPATGDLVAIAREIVARDLVRGQR